MNTMTNTTMLSEQLQAIDRALLTPLVQQFFSSDAVEVLDWHIEPIKFNIVNPLTVGLYRFSGTAQQYNTVRLWSMVLKIMHPQAFVPEALWKAPDSIFYM